jgi:DNA-binding transcriptional LysR family regulator
MAAHNIHIGFLSEPIDPVLFDSFVWHRGNIFLVVGKDHRLAERASIKLRELQNEAIVVFQEDTYPQNIIAKLCARQGIIPSFYLEGFETGLFYELCSTNKIAALWEGPLDNFPGCVRIEIEDVSLEWEARFIVQKNVYLNNAEKLFIEYAKNTLTIE